MANVAVDRQLPTRVSAACDRCRRNKSRCDPYRPCSLCVRANVECLIRNVESSGRPPKRRRTLSPVPQAVRVDTSIQQDEGLSTNVSAEVASFDASRRPSTAQEDANSAMGIVQRIYQLSSEPSLKRTTSAIPGGDVCGTNSGSRLDRAQRRPIRAVLGYPLPSVDMMRMLLEEYFDAVHWFSLVIYEPRFRSKFDSISDGLAHPSQKAFLQLLSTVIGMGSWYKSHKSAKDPDFPDEDWLGLSMTLVEGVAAQLIDLMDQVSLASIQLCILLGSYYVYHGRPNLSFALLGATIRMAHAIGLHRQTSRAETPIDEERKRVWWTIYTWDRFASITYGRPLGINDSDCSMTQPNEVRESPYFRHETSSNEDNKICYSSYQRELNKLYLIASPTIGVVFGMRSVVSRESYPGPQYLNQIMEVTERLWNWRRHLPAHLLLDLRADCEANPSRTSKVHHLQALSLQLTFDSLLIIFHRPLLSQQVDYLIRNQPDSSQGATQSPSSRSNNEPSPAFAANATSPLSRSGNSSTEYWWDAALRTSRVTEMPHLAQLATDSHLVAFLAINLFNSAIVMAVLALSDPLSDRAQEVKRTVTRIFRLQELLGKRSQLSMQSNVVLKDIIRMLLRREADAMLGDVTTAQSEGPLMSVEETLRLPMQLPPSGINYQQDSHHQDAADRVMRVNESLASLQRVFPTGVDPIYNANNQESGSGIEDFSQVPNTNNNDWSQVDQQSSNFAGDLDLGDDMGFDIAGNGLYWFWDSNWGQSQF